MAEADDRLAVRALVVGGLGGVDDEIGEVLGEVAARRRAGVLLQLVERAAHLGPVHERAVAADAERDPGAPQRLLERRRLRVHAVQHREVRPAPARRARRAAAARRRAPRRRRRRTW